MLASAFCFAFRAAAVLFALPWLLCQVCEGQTAAVEARVTSVDGPALASGNSRPPRQLFRGELVLPGAEIDTRGGGTLTIGLSDGSVVVVEPGSRIVFKDYRSAASVRDLFNIFIGRVRVTINRVGGRPNPYRIDTPTASIAVRGTDFSVAVDSSGETLVVVYEGQVEVTSLIQPNQRFLVEPGRGIVVRVNQDIRYFTPVAGVVERQVEEKGEHSKEVAQSNPGRPVGRQEESPRNTAGTYQRFIASLVESDQTPFLLRFIAFPDSYLDSFQNPSYATEFHAAEGRAFVIPSLSGSQALEANSSKSSEEPGRPVDYSVSPQVSYFTPVAGGRTVLGGSVAASKSGLQASTLTENLTLTSPVFVPGSVGTGTTADSITNSYLTGSFVIARQLEEASRTSIGFGIDQVTGRGLLQNLTTQRNMGGMVSNERVESRSTVRETLLKAGILRDLFGNHKLGMFYRYGFENASDADRSRVLNGAPQPLDSSATSGRTNEIGIRLRGPMTRRLVYGLEGSTLSLHLDDRLRRAAGVDSHQRDKIRRSAVGFGLGFALRPRTILSLDLSGGLDSVDYRRTEDATGQTLETQRQTNRFFSTHMAIQADVWRKLFVSSSFLLVRQSLNSTLTLYPDRFGRSLTSNGLFSPGGPAYDRYLGYYSEFSAGWRFNTRVLAQYVVSTDYGLTLPSHTLLLRYTFHPHAK